MSLHSWIHSPCFALFQHAKEATSLAGEAGFVTALHQGTAVGAPWHICPFSDANRCRKRNFIEMSQTYIGKTRPTVDANTLLSVNRGLGRAGLTDM